MYDIELNFHFPQILYDQRKFTSDFSRYSLIGEKFGLGVTAAFLSWLEIPVAGRL